MKHEISVRNYRPEDVQTLANIYYNTIHRVNIQHYTKNHHTLGVIPPDLNEVAKAIAEKDGVLIQPAGACSKFR